MSGWVPAKVFVDGDKLSSDGLNPPIEALIQRTEYLKNSLDVLEADGVLSGIRLTGQNMEGINPGEVVYLGRNISTDTWEWRRAIASALDFPNTTEVSPSSYVVGVCEKPGTVIMYGKSPINGSSGITLNSIHLESGSERRPGPYYLSSSEPGKMTTDKSSVAVYVGTFFRELSIIQPSIRDNADAHTHYAVPLSSRAAGHAYDAGFSQYDPEWVLVGRRHDSDSGDIPTYATLAATGAPPEGVSYVIVGVVKSGSVFNVDVYGYDANGNIMFSKDFNDLPSLYRGVDGLPFTVPGLGLSLFFIPPKVTDYTDTTMFATRKTFTIGGNSSIIHDLSGWVPLPPPEPGYVFMDSWGVGGIKNTLLTPAYVYNVMADKDLSRYYPPNPMTASALVKNGVEMSDATKLFRADYVLTPNGILWFAESSRPWAHVSETGPFTPQNVFYSARRVDYTGVVTSIRSGAKSPIRFRATGSTQEATSGDLEAFLNLVLDTDVGDTPGYMVVKETEDNGLIRGPVVESVRAGEGIVISNRAGEPLSDGRFQGNLIISSSTGRGDIGRFGALSLENAKQGRNGMFSYVTLPARKESGKPDTGFTSSFQIPYKVGDSDAYKARIMMTVFGDRSLPPGESKRAALNFEYSVLPDDYDNTIGTTIIDAPVRDRGIFSVVFPESYNAYDPIRLSTGPGGYLGDDVPDNNLSEPILKPGYTLGIRFRSGSDYGASYPGNLCVLSLWWELIRM